MDFRAGPRDIIGSNHGLDAPECRCVAGLDPSRARIRAQVDIATAGTDRAVSRIDQLDTKNDARCRCVAWWRMDQLNGLNVPKSLIDICRPERLALLVYDMQVGILEQIADRQKVIQNVHEVLETARAARVRTYFTHHVTLPVELMGVAQLRMWRAWQRVDRLEDVRSPFPPDAPQTQIVPELRPSEKEAVFDKLTLSAFAGTPLELALRGAGIEAIAVVGVATEIGIEPTVRHAGDLGFIPVVVTDACASGNAEAEARTMETLRFLGDAMLTDVAGFRDAVRGRN